MSRAVAGATRLAKGRAKGKHPRRRAALLPPPFASGHAGQLKDGDMSGSAGMGMTDRNKSVDARVPPRCIASGKARPSRAGVRRTTGLECLVICQAHEARDSVVSQGQGRAG